jgi:cysteine desulfurase
MSVKLPIYLDHNATTPVDQRVFEAMKPYFCEVFGNAASRGHSFGWEAEAAVDKARSQIANLVNGKPEGIIFTSGATESDNLAIKGVACRYRAKGRHIITQTTEHKAVIDTCRKLQHDGYEITWLGVDRKGRVDPDELRKAIRPDTILVTIMWANNEIGTIQPMREIGRICRERDVLLHSDATQGVGKIPVDIEADNVDLLSFTGHKIYGPKGCGGLCVRSREPKIELECLIDGGGHERGFRSGTLNVPGIVGLGAACEIAMNDMADDAQRLSMLRDRLERAIIEQVENVTVNGDVANRLPHMTNLTFGGIDSDDLMLATCDVAVSSGSACSSATAQSSYVLRACGVPHELAQSSLRFACGRRNREDEIDYVSGQFARTLGKPTPSSAVRITGFQPVSEARLEKP